MYNFLRLPPSEYRFAGVDPVVSKPSTDTVKRDAKNARRMKNICIYCRGSHVHSGCERERSSEPKVRISSKLKERIKKSIPRLDTLPDRVPSKSEMVPTPVNSWQTPSALYSRKSVNWMDNRFSRSVASNTKPLQSILKPTVGQGNQENRQNHVFESNSIQSATGNPLIRDLSLSKPSVRTQRMTNEQSDNIDKNKYFSRHAKLLASKPLTESPSKRLDHLSKVESALLSSNAHPKLKSKDKELWARSLSQFDGPLFGCLYPMHSLRHYHCGHHH